MRLEVDRESEILIERIQSIKEEKEEITYRLPELDQRGSDEENLDSETSISTESLLDERAAHLDAEGLLRIHVQPLSQNVGDMAINISRSSPATDAFSFGVLLKDNLEISSISLAPPDRSFATAHLQRRPSSFLAKMKVHRRNPVIPVSNIRLPYGIVRSSESMRSAAGASSSQLVVRMRDQPARRKDSIHSMYIAHGPEQSEENRQLVDYEPTMKLKRRFSDPFLHIPCVEESNL